jgi:hypothetical protein
MNTLKEVKEELRVEIRSLKSSIKYMKKEHGLDRDSHGVTGGGFVTTMAKQEQVNQMRVQLENTQRFYSMLTKVRRMK